MGTTTLSTFQFPKDSKVKLQNNASKQSSGTFQSLVERDFLAQVSKDQQKSPGPGSYMSD